MSDDKAKAIELLIENRDRYREELDKLKIRSEETLKNVKSINPEMYDSVQKGLDQLIHNAEVKLKTYDETIEALRK